MQGIRAGKLAKEDTRMQQLDVPVTYYEKKTTIKNKECHTDNIKMTTIC